MSFLLDTNVISEWAKPRPDRGVITWLSEADEDRVFISVVTIAELRHGVERLPAGARRKRLDDWLTRDITLRFEARMLAVDVETTEIWGRVVASRQTGGRPIGVMDAFIAAAAERHDLTLVTRNLSDFDALGIRTLSPWTGE